MNLLKNENERNGRESCGGSGVPCKVIIPTSSTRIRKIPPPVPPRRSSIPAGMFNNNGGSECETSLEMFLHQNVRNVFKPPPRIFPMENTYGVERVPTPFLFNSSDFGIRSRKEEEREKFNNNNSLLPPFTTATYAEKRLLSAVGDKDALLVARAATILTNSCCTTTTSNSRFYPALPDFSVMMSSPATRRSSGGGHQSRQPDFATALKKWSAPIPPVLSRKLGRVSESPLGKVKVMLRVCETSDDASGILGIDSRKKQVTLIDPGGNSGVGITPEERRVGVSAPKMFAFDGIFGDEDDQAEICAASAAELVASVVGGEDGCFVSLGSSCTGKKQTMFGKPANQKMGVVPTTISWLFKSIQEQKQKAGSRFSVRISALTVTGGSGHEVINDLLLPFANDGDHPPGAYLGNGNNGQGTGSNPGNKFTNPSVLSTVSEVRAPSPERAGFFFDTALESMRTEDPVRHFIFTIHVYQYTVDKNGKGVVGGRSRLHCVKLGNGSPSISVLGGLLLAVLNGQRHLPSRDSKLGAILRECLGSLTCRAVVMIHVSNAHSRYAETLAALQLGSRVHRLRRSRRLKMGSVGSGNGSGGSSGGSGEEMRNGPALLASGTSGVGATICEGETGSSDIDPSSSEQSCDTVIYLGPSIDDCTDGENPPIYLPCSLDGENGIDPKIQSAKLPITSSLPPKTKSPKPKSNSSAKHHHNGGGGGGNYVTPNGKSEEQWVDGPKVPKYHHASVASLSSATHTAPKKSETWIDGPAASRIVNHQANNFPSPKKSQNGRDPPPLPSIPSISSVKAQMIQQWISNQSNSHSPFDEEHLVDTSMYLLQSSHCHHPHHEYQYLSNPYQSGDTPIMSDGTTKHHDMALEPEYKSLTVFKTCEDDYFDDEENNYGCNGFEFEFIEVVEPEIPVPTRDACLQVTEEDIALSFLEENPLPAQSDKNFTMGNDAYYFPTSATQPSPKNNKGAEERVSNGHSKSFSLLIQQHQQPIQSSSPPPPLSTTTTTTTNDDHPLRVLSQECLTVVSTFTDSLPRNGDLERFWPRLSFAEDLSSTGKKGGGSHYHHHNHGLCKNLASLSQMSLVGDEPLTSPCCLYNSGNDEPGILSPLSTMRNQIKSSEILPTGSVRPKTVVDIPAPPILSDESIFKIPSAPPVGINKKTNGIWSEKPSRDSDAEQESVVIPPMKLLNLTPIVTSSNANGDGVGPKPAGTMPPDQFVRRCDHNHHHQILQQQHQQQSTQHCQHVLPGLNGTPGTVVVGQNGNNGNLTPPSPPEILQTKSPSKSKSRKIAKFFRGRSKSPKKGGSIAMSSSESGKSSGSSTVSAETKSCFSSSSGSSSCCSSANSPSTNSGGGNPATNNNIKMTTITNHRTFKNHNGIPSSPSKKSNGVNKAQPILSTPPPGTTDYHFNCDSPSKETENGGGGGTVGKSK